MSAAERLARGQAALGLDLSAEAQQRLLDYCALLHKWNRVYNLTAVRDEHKVISHHLLDSLAVLSHLKGTSVADVGSGGGLPGIPLAIARADWQVALAEAGHKKASFLQQAKIELGLDNVSVHNVRVEAWQPQQKFDIVISRAFSDLAEFARLSQHLLAPGGHLYAMKGIYPDEEIGQLPDGFRVESIVELQVPEIDVARHLVVIARKN